jgi:hypothetical protein
MFACYYQGAQDSDSSKELHVYDAGGKLVWKIDNFPEKISALRFYKDILIVATDNSLLYAYDVLSGTRKGVIELEKALYHSSLQVYDGGSGDLILDSGSGTVFMVDYGQWALTGAAFDAVGYCPAMRRIIGSTEIAENRYGYCPYYSVDDLVEKGKAFVGEQTMSEADLATYGLN